MFLCNEFNKEYNINWKDTFLQENALYVLKKIQSKNIFQSILSAQEFKQLNRYIKHYKIKSFFDYVIGLDNNKAEGKLESGQKLISLLKIQPQKILLIGDTNYDYYISKKLNVDCVLFYSGHQSKERLKATGCKVISRLEEVLNFL